MGGRILAAAGAVCLALGLAAGRTGAADVTVLGCNERGPGEIGIRELLGAVGDTVGVAVTVNATGPIDAFALDVAFPESLLAYVRTDPGELTAGFFVLRGKHLTGQALVRIDGFDPDPIPSGAVGRLAIVHFEVLAAGVDSFATLAYVDDVQSYTPCEAVHSPTSLARTTWGRVKTAYR